jgi:hypothetical protein
LLETLTPEKDNEIKCTILKEFSHFCLPKGSWEAGPGGVLISVAIEGKYPVSIVIMRP